MSKSSSEPGQTQPPSGDSRIADDASIKLSAHGVDNPFYFFSANSWQAALSTGALGSMPPEEVAVYAQASEGIHRYSELQSATFSTQSRFFAFLKSHPDPHPQELQEEIFDLELFYRQQQAIVHVCPQMIKGIQRAISAANKH